MFKQIYGVAASLFFFTSPILSLAQEEAVPDPEIERASFKVADGFEVTLFAADPKIAKPIGMNFDTKGRLWVASSSLYPQIKPGEVANDKIIILEDKNGDGRAEAGTVFAEGLHIPTGIEIGDGGAYVANSTELIHLKDTNGDGKADQQRVVLSGFGTEDTHHILHTLRFGPDGQLYMNQSIYIHADIETPHGPRHLSGSGTWRFRPRTMELEVFTRGLVNPWGHTWDYFGQDFATDGAGGDGISIYIPNAAYGSWGTDAKRWMSGLNPGSPKYCSLETISGRHFPDDWQGSLITADFRANRVVRFVIREEGSGYTSTLMPDVIKSTDKAFRPVDAKMGPDGALYIADWYNPIINHGEVDFRDARRDHTHGRIWRVAAKGRPLVERPKIAGAAISQLLEDLKSPEGYTRHMARRELYERDAKEVATALAGWVKGLDASDANSEHYRLEALWTYETIDVTEPELLAKLLRSKDAHIRAAATRAIYFLSKRLSNGLDLLAVQVADENPKVRLEAIRALSQFPSIRAMELAMQATDQPTDRFIDYALYLTANALKDVWMPDVLAGKLPFNGNTRHLVAALDAAGSREALGPIMELLKSGKIGADKAESFFPLITSQAGPEELAELWVWLIGLKDAKLQGKALAVLESAARTRGQRPAIGLVNVEGLFSSQDETVKALAIRLAGEWKVTSASVELARLAKAAETPARVRLAAIDALGNLGGAENVALLTKLAEANGPVSLRVMAISGLVSVDTKAAAERAAELLAADKISFDPAPLLSAFLQKPSGAQTLAAALTGKKLAVSSDTAKLALRFMYSTGRNEPALTDLLRSAAAVSAQITQLSGDQMKQLAAEVQTKGDAARGERVFRGKTTSCFNCHAIGGAGGQLGPDLSAVGSASPVEYLIDSVLFPSKNVKEGFEAVAITTKSNDFFAGIPVTQNERELVLRDAISSQIAIPLDTIKTRKNAGSLMPTGLADLLTHDEFLDLIKFLSSLGTSGHDVAPVAVVRRWRALEPAPTEPSLPAALSDDSLIWSMAYSDVAGALPLTDVPKASKSVSVVRCEVDMSTGGPVLLRLNSADGVTLWADSTPAAAKPETALELGRGVHSLTFRIDRDQRQEQALRVSLHEAPGSTARFRIVGGK